MHRAGLSSMLLVWLTVSSCSPETTGENAPLLAYVPSDTPYLIASGEPFPDSYVERMQKFSKQLVSIEADELEDSLDEAELDEATEGFLRQVMTELLEQTSGAANAKRSFVVYGRGLAPTLRSEIQDEARLRAFFESLVANADIPVQVGERGGETYWRAELDEWIAIATLRDGVLAAGGGTRATEEALLDHLFLPASGDAAAVSRTLESIRSKHDFAPQAIGYLDTRALLQSAPAELRPDAACQSRLDAYATTVPRVVGGYGELSGESLTFRGIIELEESVARQISEWSIPVPGLEGTNALLALGLGIDMQKAMGQALAWQARWSEQATECGLTAAPVNPAAAPGMQLMLGLAGNPQGVRLAVDEIPKDLAAPAGGWSVSALLTAQNPQTAVLFASQSVSLSALLNSPGKAVPLPVPPSLPIDVALWGMLTDEAIVIASGVQAEDRVEALVKAPKSEPGTLLGLEVDVAQLADSLTPQLEADGALRALILARASSAGTEPNALQRSEAELDRSVERLKRYGEMVERFEMTVRATAQGLELRETVSLR